MPNQIDREFPEQEEADEEGDEHPRPRELRDEPANAVASALSGPAPCRALQRTP